MTSLLRPSARLLGVAVALCAFAGVMPRYDVGARGRAGNRPWVATWAAGAAWRTTAGGNQSPAPTPPQGAQAPQTATAAGRGTAASAAPGPVVPVDINDQTLRQIVHTSIGGDRVRVVFSNVFGTSPLPIGGAYVGLRKKDAAIVGVGTPAPLWWPALDDDSAWRRHGQRRRRPPRPRTNGSRDRFVFSREHGTIHVADHSSQSGVSDQLHFSTRQPCRV